MDKVTINTQIIDKFIKENSLTKKEFCKMCDISLSTLYNIYDGKCNLRINKVFNIAVVTNVRMKDLIGFWNKKVTDNLPLFLSKNFLCKNFCYFTKHFVKVILTLLFS